MSPCNKFDSRKRRRKSILASLSTSFPQKGKGLKELDQIIITHPSPDRSRDGDRAEACSGCHEPDFGSPLIGKE